MFLIEGVTEDPKQQRTLTLSDGTTLFLAMEFVEMQYGWFITELTYGDFTLHGMRVTSNPNMLHQFRNQLPFGLACFTRGDREPTFIKDFSSQASKLYILSAAEVVAYTEFLSGQV